MHIKNKIALVTGANRGLGREFARQLLTLGAAKVYAAARRPELIDIPGVEPLELDITNPGQVKAAAEIAGDVDLLINNAGVSLNADLVTGDLDKIRLEMDTNFWGTLAMIRAFAPHLRDGAILNVNSALSWFAWPGAGGYAAAKAAEWNLTNSVRLELRDQNTLVTGLHLGAADTDMMGDYEGPKTPPAVIVKAALEGIEAGAWEVVADEWSANVKASLANDPSEFPLYK